MPATPTLTLARELIARPSITPDDAGCQQLIAERLAALGFVCQRLKFGDVNNLWAVRGDTGPLFCFAGHTDVVPPGPEELWESPPFEPSERDGMLYGRGAADMKGSLAAMVTAIETFLTRHPDPQCRLAFLITSDEEGIAEHGTREVMQWLEQKGETIRWCVVGEPSSSKVLADVVKVGRRGSLNARLTILGQQGHVAYPELADNPINRALPALLDLVNTEWDMGNAHFPPTGLQISNIRAGTGATNVIPGEIEFLFNFRFSTVSAAADLQARVETMLDRHELNYELDWQLSGNPFLTDRGELIEATLAAISHVVGRDAQLSTGGGTSDGRFIAPGGAEVVELGPLNTTIHQVNECVGIEDIETLAQIYVELLNRLLIPTMD